MTWSCIAVRNSSVSAKKSAFVSRLFIIIIIVIVIIIIEFHFNAFMELVYVIFFGNRSSTVPGGRVV